MVRPILQKAQSLQNVQLFRYLVAAVSATLTDIILFFLLFNFVFVQVHYDLLLARFDNKFICIAISYTAGVLVNFFISRFYVFPDAQGRKRWQLVRFVLVGSVVFVGNFLMLEFLFYAIPQVVTLPPKLLSLLARGLAAVVVSVLSFSLHKVFTFKA